jgi:hypothetical protein
LRLDSAAVDERDDIIEVEHYPATDSVIRGSDLSGSPSLKTFHAAAKNLRALGLPDVRLSVDNHSHLNTPLS